MKLRRTLVCLTLAVCLLLLCFEGIAAGGAGAAKVTIKLWSHWASEARKKEFTMKAVEAFEKANPNIDIEVDWYEKYQLMEIIRAEMAVGSGKPDIFYLDPDPDPRYGGSPWVTEGLVADITKYLDLSKYDKADLAAWDYNGKIYGIPLEGGLFMLYVNKKILKEAGVSFPPANGRNFTREEFKEAVKKIRAAGYVPVASGGLEYRTISTDSFVTNCLVRQLGIEGLDQLVRGKIGWDDSRVLSALQFVEELGKLRAWPDELLSMRFVDGFLMFSRGEAAMYSDGPWMFSRAANPIEQGGLPPTFELDVMDYPAVKGGAFNDISVKTIGGCWVVSGQSKHIPEAASFLRFISTPEWAKEWVRIVRGQTGILGGMDLSVAHPILAKAQSLQDSGRVMLPGAGAFLLQGTVRDTWLQTACKALLVKQMDAETVVQKMVEATKRK